MECSFCGMKSAKTFYCPLCGQDFCSAHKLHRDHYSDPRKTTEPQKTHSSTTQEKIITGSHILQILAALLVLAVIIVGADLAFGIHLIPDGSGSKNLPPTPGTPGQQYSAANPPVTTITPLPATAKNIYPRPVTGTSITGNKLYGGKGELTIDNLQGGTDAIAVLTSYGMKTSLTSVYIRSGEISTMKNIPDGIYELYIQTGGNWNSAAKKFENSPSYTRFSDSFPYTTTETNRETATQIITDIKYTAWTVTLYKVVDGNAKSEVVSEESFPEL
jgi:hypothetical protein